MRMQGEEDVVKFRRLLLRELLAERERLQRVLDSKVTCASRWCCSHAAALDLSMCSVFWRLC